MTGERRDPDRRARAQDNINHLLSTLIRDFVAYDPGRLAAGALALAASRGEVIGYFRLDGRLVRVLRRKVEVGRRWGGAAVKQRGRHLVPLPPPGATPENGARGIGDDGRAPSGRRLYP